MDIPDAPVVAFGGSYGGQMLRQTPSHTPALLQRSCLLAVPAGHVGSFQQPFGCACRCQTRPAALLLMPLICIPLLLQVATWPPGCG